MFDTFSAEVQFFVTPQYPKLDRNNCFTPKNVGVASGYFLNRDYNHWHTFGLAIPHLVLTRSD
jgi:hypothetical protein